MNFLPGWYPSTALGAKLSVISFFGSSTAAGNAGTTSITAPSSILPGDLMVLSNTSSAGSAAAVVPSGFTQVNTGIVGGTRMVTSYKIADGTEGGSSLTGMTADTSWQACLYVFRGNVAIKTITAASVNGEATAGDPVTQTVTASGGTPPLVVFGTYRGSTPAARSFSPAADGSIANGAPFAGTLSLAYKIYNTSPADVSIDMTDEGIANLMQSFYLACT